MENEQHNESGLQKFNLIMVLILMVALIGGFSYFMMRINNFLDDQKQVEQLYVEINDLESEVTEEFSDINEKLEMISKKDVEDEKVVIKTATYTNDEKGISFSFPYQQLNDESGNPAAPYVEDFDREDPFLGIIPTGGSSFPWKIHVRFSQPTDFDAGGEMLEINGLDVMKTEVGGLCYYPTMTVIGNNYLYAFYPSCSSKESAADDFKMLEEIIKTIKLK
jgi:hypothetical protein